MNKQTSKNDWFKLCRVRALNLKFRGGKVAAYVVLAVIFLALDFVAAYLSNHYDAQYSGYDDQDGNHIMQYAFKATSLWVWIVALINSVVLVALSTTVFAIIFSSDKKNNQMSLELRSGYNRRDIYTTKLLEAVVAILIPLVIVIIVNLIMYGAWENRAVFSAGYGRQKVVMTATVKNSGAALLVNSIWWYLLAFLISAAITFGLSFTSSTAGAAAGGSILGTISIVIIIMLSIGILALFIPGTKYPWWTPLLG